MTVLKGANTWERSNAYVATGWEQVYIKARVGYHTPNASASITTPGAIILHLEASLGGSFVTRASAPPYEIVLIETTRIPIQNDSAGIIEIRAAYAIPAPGTWYWRVRATSTVHNQYSQNTAVIYEVFHMNNNNEPAV